MKRIIVGLVAAFLMVAGLVTVSSSPATAACPYTNCIETATNTVGRSTIPAGSKVTIKVGVRSAGNTYPNGVVTLTVYKKGKRGVFYTATKQVTPAEPYVSRTQLTTRAFPKGVYNMIFKFRPASDSVFKASQNKRTLTVR